MEHQDYLRAGAFYPDAFYNCLGLSDVAEASHWPPFLAAGAQLVREKEQAGKDAGPLRAFLYGALSHQVSDVSWHSLGVHQGLLKVMADSEFNGNIDDAHSTLDVGGDMIQVYRLLSSGQNIDWLTESWTYDSQDIKEVLAKLGYNSVSSTQINYCMAQGRAALTAELNVAKLGYIRYAQKSPTIFDQLEDYFVGGMVDMHLQTVECAGSFEPWFENAVSDPWDICQVFDGKRPHHNIKLVLDYDPYVNQLEKMIKKVKPYTDSFKSTISEQSNSKVVAANQFSQLGKSVLFWGGNWVVSAPAIGQVFVLDENLKVKFVLKGSVKEEGEFYSRFGAALATLFLQGQEFLVVSSPGQSQLDFFDVEGNYRGTLVWPDAITKYGGHGIKLVGESILADWTGLYVGAPYADVTETQDGAVYKILYKEIAELVMRNDTQYVQEEPISGAAKYARFGMKLAASNQFVLVGAPGLAKVYGFDPWTLKLKLTLDGPPNSGFGGYLLEQSPQGYIAIGAPLHDEGGTQSGSVFVYKNTGRKAFSGSSSFAYFGHSGTLFGSSIYIGSAHAENERGAIWRLDLNQYSFEKLTSGLTPGSGGFAAKLASNGTHLLVGAPYFDQLGGVALYNTTE